MCLDCYDQKLYPEYSWYCSFDILLPMRRDEAFSVTSCLVVLRCVDKQTVSLIASQRRLMLPSTPRTIWRPRLEPMVRTTVLLNASQVD